MNTLSLQRLIGITVELFFCLTAANAQSDNARPQLSAEQAAAYSYANVLNTGSQRWDPRSDRLLSEHAIKPDYIVDQSAAETSASVFRSLQSCINRIVIDTEHVATRRRVYVLLKPGTYHELLYLPPMPVALTVYGIGTDPGQTRIAADLDATVTGSDYLHQFEKQFAGVDAQTRAMVSTVASRPFIGTDGTAVAWIQNEGFQAKNITIQNTYSMPADCLRSGCHEGNVKGSVVHHQAVALMLDGADKSQFEQVRVLGHQDTLYMKTSARNPLTRIFFNRSHIEGDVDFIFGDATGYFDQSEIKSLADRPTSYMAAPSTNYQTQFGFVFNACHFTSDGGNSADGKFYLGRQWFHNQKCTPYANVNVADYSCKPGLTDQYSEPTGTISKSVLETVGKVIIMNSRIGAHIDKQHPWSDWNKPGALAYRPAQTNSDDYWQNLLNAKIDPVYFMGYIDRKTPVEWFLAEFNNSND